MGKIRRKTALILFAVAAVIIYYVHEAWLTVHAQRELEAAKTVAVLPPGTEEAWLAYVDRRIAATLQRQGATVHLVDYLDRMAGRTEYVSINAPYEISCDLSGGDIKFGHGGDGTGIDASVSVYGMLTDQDPAAEKAPPLGVNMMSVAANTLREHLCQHLAKKVEAIFAQQP